MERNSESYYYSIFLLALDIALTPFSHRIHRNRLNTKNVCLKYNKEFGHCYIDIDLCFCLRQTQFLQIFIQATDEIKQL